MFKRPSNSFLKKFTHIFMSIHTRNIRDEEEELFLITKEFQDVIIDAVTEYNNTIHSVTNVKLAEVFFNQQNFSEIPDLLKKAQTTILQSANRKKTKKKFMLVMLFISKITDETFSLCKTLLLMTTDRQSRR